MLNYSISGKENWIKILDLLNVSKNGSYKLYILSGATMYVTKRHVGILKESTRTFK